jgi:predicted DsbA family dithiol-disulfide isomerase
MTKLRLDVVSDVVCPWCWLGKRRLDAALSEVEDLDVEVSYRPFQLDPDVRKGGVDYRAYMTAKFGDLSRIRASQAHLTAAGAEAGITYRFDEIPLRPNTFNAHRVIRWAQGQGKGSEAVEAMFRAHFDELRDIGDKTALADIAGEIGLDRDVVAHLLDGDQDVQEVRAEEAFFRKLGVAAVPTFIGNGRAAVQGAQETEALARFLRAASAMKDTRLA